MGAPSQTNSAADFVNGLIKSLNQGGIKAAEVFITSLDPAFFSMPIVAFLLDKGVEWIDSFIQEIEIKDATALVIDIQTNGEHSAVVRAANALAFAKASKDQNAIDKAKTNLSNAYGDLIHFDGLARP